MKDPINQRAAEWWAERFGIEEKREALKEELLKVLPNDDWETYNDYDPWGLLLEAVRNSGVECRGFMFSGDGLFPQKTGIKRMDNQLLAKEGYGRSWEKVEI